MKHPAITWHESNGHRKATIGKIVVGYVWKSTSTSRWLSQSVLPQCWTQTVSGGTAKEMKAQLEEAVTKWFAGLGEL